MSKIPKFSDKEILGAALELHAEGKKVTSTTVRLRLGGGSEPYLKAAITRLRTIGQLDLAGPTPTEYDAIYEQIKRILDERRSEDRKEAFNQQLKEKERFEALINQLRSEINHQKEQLQLLKGENQGLQYKLDTQGRELAAAHTRIQKLNQDAAVAAEALANANQALEKSEAKNENLLQSISSTHTLHTNERKELLAEVVAITKSSQAAIKEARASEDNMRHQLKSAMTDGVKYTTVNAKLRETLKQLEPGKTLLKQHGSWEKIRTLCKSNEKTPRKQK